MAASPFGEVRDVRHYLRNMCEAARSAYPDDPQALVEAFRAFDKTLDDPLERIQVRRLARCVVRSLIQVGIDINWIRRYLPLVPPHTLGHVEQILALLPSALDQQLERAPKDISPLDWLPVLHQAVYMAEATANFHDGLILS